MGPEMLLVSGPRGRDDRANFKACTEQGRLQLGHRLGRSFEALDGERARHAWGIEADSPEGYDAIGEFYAALAGRLIPPAGSPQEFGRRLRELDVTGPLDQVSTSPGERWRASGQFDLCVLEANLLSHVPILARGAADA